MYESFRAFAELGGGDRDVTMSLKHMLHVLFREHLCVEYKEVSDYDHERHFHKTCTEVMHA